MTTRPVELPPTRFLASLVEANQVLAREGIVDGFGHISRRHPERTDVYVMARAIAPAVVTVEDFQVFYLDGTTANGDQRGPYLERPIHGAVYAARQDVQAVCHSHAPALIPFAVTGVELRPVYHMASLMGHSVPLWDIAVEFGETNLLVTDNARGRSLARALGDAPVTLMRGHGAVFASSTLSELIVTAVYAVKNAQILATAQTLGPPAALSAQEVALAAEILRSPGAIEKAWQALRADNQGVR